MKRLRLALVAIAVLLAPGCLRPDGRAPHRLVVSNMEAYEIHGNLSVALKDDVLVALPLGLAAGATIEREFGPARAGDYLVRIERETGEVVQSTERMGRGGWGLYVSFYQNGTQFSTLHGD